MSTKDLIASNKDPNTKKVFKLAEETIRKITQLHLNNPKIKVELDYWDWDGEDYKYLHHDKKDFEDVKIINFEAVPGDEADTFLLCYVASMEIDLNK